MAISKVRRLNETGVTPGSYTAANLTVDAQGRLTSVSSGGAGGVPSGAILMWSGSIASIPSDWALCDGTNGTPDLRDRFIVGAGGSFAVNMTGGSATAALPAHTHSGSSATTSLTGSVSFDEGMITGTSGVFYLAGGIQRDIPDANNASLHDAFGFDATHSHTGSLSSAGVDPTNANLPPYYSLAYIMKL